MEPRATGTSWSWLVVLVGMFACAGLFGRALYNRAVTHQRERLELERKLAAASDMFARRTSPSTFAAEVGHWAEIARRQPLPCDRLRDTEDAVRALLRAARATRHEHAA
jgi:hypothetical protein